MPAAWHGHATLRVRNKLRAMSLVCLASWYYLKSHALHGYCLLWLLALWSPLLRFTFGRLDKTQFLR